jgi:uncharacterized glyoxalase superfamily protein PhnB
MAMKRAGDSWMPAEDYGRTLPQFTVNLLVADMGRSVEFYRTVLEAKVVYSDADFAALELDGLHFMLHADHAYEHHPWHERLVKGERRGLGAELRLFGRDPDAVQERAKRAGTTILQTAQEMPHGWRDVIVADPDGYAWAIGMPGRG